MILNYNIAECHFFLLTDVFEAKPILVGRNFDRSRLPSSWSTEMRRPGGAARSEETRLVNAISPGVRPTKALLAVAGFVVVTTRKK
jgi:hypothetical protein